MQVTGSGFLPDISIHVLREEDDLCDSRTHCVQQ